MNAVNRLLLSFCSGNFIIFFFPEFLDFFLLSVLLVHVLINCVCILSVTAVLGLNSILSQYLLLMLMGSGDKGPYFFPLTSLQIG